MSNEEDKPVWPLDLTKLPAKPAAPPPRPSTTSPTRATGPVPLARTSEPRAVPLAERLPHAPTGPVTPSWVAQRGPSPKARPLRAHSQSLTVVPVAKSAEEEWLAERQKEIDEARMAAEQEGLRVGQAKVEMLAQRYLDAIGRLGTAVREARRPSVDEIVDLAFLVAREIVGRELAVDHDHLMKRLDEVLAHVAVDASLVLRLGAADMAYVRRRRPELVAAGVQFVEDASLGPGGCQIETPKAAIELSTDARLAAVRAQIGSIVADAASAAQAGLGKPAHADRDVFGDAEPEGA
jgi:flagellar biosynthesis/type III secretory pathway protein FliH